MYLSGSFFFVLFSVELPPSAAQDPQTPTTPGRKPKIQYPSPGSQEERGKNTIPPPPPPPLPPATFAVTLPTSITFLRNPASATATSNSNSNNCSNSNNTGTNNAPLSGDQNKKNVSPIIPTTVPFMVGSFSINSEALSKEAQDILKISEDLSNFGKEHARKQAQMQMMSRDAATFEMLLGKNTEMPCISDAMEVGGDSNRSNVRNTDFVTTDSSNAPSTTVTNDSQMVIPSAAPMCVDSPSPRTGRNKDDIFDDLRSLIPNEMDVSMPMEMDYCDWLENLLPSESTTGSNNNNAHVNNNSSSSIVDSNSNMSSGHGYGGMMDFGGDQSIVGNNVFHQRDPLLCSRSLDIFSAARGCGDGIGGSHDNSSGVFMGDVVISSGNNQSGVDNSGGGVVVNVKHGNCDPVLKQVAVSTSSPMSMSDSLLWDFAM